MRVRHHRLAPMLAAVGLLLAACGGGGGDREAAIDNLMAGPDGLSQTQAECVVDEIGEDNLGDYDNFSPEFQQDLEDEFGGSEPDLSSLAEMGEEMGTLMGAMFSCIMADLGDAFDDGGGPTSGGDGPQDYGDDAALDALWDACADGSGEACDDLYFQSPFGSRYEEFGDTCGDRQEPGGICAESLPG